MTFSFKRDAPWVNAVPHRDKVEYEIYERELERMKLQHLGNDYENEVMFWVSIHDIVSPAPEGMKGFLDILKSQCMSLYEMIQHRGD